MENDSDEALDGGHLVRKGTARDSWIINQADEGSRKVYLAFARPLQSPVKLTRTFAKLFVGLNDQTRVSCRILAKVPLEAQPLADLGAQIGSGAVREFIRTNAQATAAEGSNGPLQPGMPLPPGAQAPGAPGVLVTVADLGDCLLYLSNQDWYVSTAKKEQQEGPWHISMAGGW
jgi:hypothetical protein